MGRFCTVCTSGRREAIDRAVMRLPVNYRRIAADFGVAETSLRRHVTDHLLPLVVETWGQERRNNGQELAAELRKWMDSIGLLFGACDRHLRDPLDPTRYDIGPRATEIWVTYDAPTEAPVRPLLVDAVVKAARALVAESGRAARMALLAAVRRLDEHDGIGEGEEDGGEEDGGEEAAVVIRTGERSVRRKARLSELLAKVDGHEATGAYIMAEAKIADPRTLIIQAAKQLESSQRLLGELIGQLASAATDNYVQSPAWIATRTKMLAALAPYPQAKLALAAALDGAEEETGDDLLALPNGGTR